MQLRAYSTFQPLQRYFLALRQRRCSFLTNLSPIPYLPLSTLFGSLRWSLVSRQWWTASLGRRGNRHCSRFMSLLSLCGSDLHYAAALPDIAFLGGYSFGSKGHLLCSSFSLLHASPLAYASSPMLLNRWDPFFPIRLQLHSTEAFWSP